MHVIHTHILSLRNSDGEIVCVNHLIIPVHFRPQALLSLQHGHDQLAPFLLHVIRMVPLRELDAPELNPHLHPNIQQSLRRPYMCHVHAKNMNDQKKKRKIQTSSIL